MEQEKTLEFSSNKMDNVYKNVLVYIFKIGVAEMSIF